MVALWLFFLLSSALLGLSLYYVVRHLSGHHALDHAGKPTPIWVFAVLAFFGALGVVSAGPGIFLREPHWFIDRLYSVVHGFSV